LLGVLTAIEFDYQFLIEADEIGNVGWDRVLPPKLEATEVAVFQMQPKPQFHIGR
jgi:hypothetical protein